MFKRILAALACFTTLAVNAANVTTFAFDTNQFTAPAAGTYVGIKSGATLTNPVVSGALTGNIIGAASSATNAATATNALNVGGQTASAVAGATVIANAATTSSVASTVAIRDSATNINARTFTGALAGNAATATSATAATTATNLIGGSISNATTYNMLGNPTNIYTVAGFTYTAPTGAGGCFMTTQIGGFNGMWPGYSIQFSNADQIEIIAFVDGSGNGSGSNATTAVISPNHFNIFAITNALMRFVSPNIYTFLDDNGNFQGAIDGGGQTLAPAWEQQGLWMFDSTPTNSLKWSFSTDEDGTRCIQLGNDFSHVSDIVTISCFAPPNSFSVRANGDFNVWDGDIIAELTHNIRAGGAVMSPQGNFNNLTITNGAQSNYVWTSTGTNGAGAWTGNLGGLSGGTLNNVISLGGMFVGSSFGTITVTNNALLSGGFTVGALSNIVSFTLVNTNWISGQLYTNQTGRPIMVSGSVVLTTAAVAGFSQMALRYNGVVTNYSTVISAVAGLTGSMTNAMSSTFIANGGIFAWTNTSSGAGDTSSTYGGQYMVY